MVDVDEYDADGLLTISQAAVRLCKSLQDVVNLIRTNQLAATRHGGVMLISEAALSRFLGGW